jgi:hypothetical protein
MEKTWVGILIVEIWGKKVFAFLRCHTHVQSGHSSGRTWNLLKQFYASARGNKRGNVPKQIRTICIKARRDDYDTATTIHRTKFIQGYSSSLCTRKMKAFRPEPWAWSLANYDELNHRRSHITQSLPFNQHRLWRSWDKTRRPPAIHTTRCAIPVRVSRVSRKMDGRGLQAWLTGWREIPRHDRVKLGGCSNVLKKKKEHFETSLM